MKSKTIINIVLYTGVSVLAISGIVLAKDKIEEESKAYAYDIETSNSVVEEVDNKNYDLQYEQYIPVQFDSNNVVPGYYDFFKGKLIKSGNVHQYVKNTDNKKIY